MSSDLCHHQYAKAKDEQNGHDGEGDDDDGDDDPQVVSRDEMVLALLLPLLHHVAQYFPSPGVV